MTKTIHKYRMKCVICEKPVQKHVYGPAMKVPLCSPSCRSIDWYNRHKDKRGFRKGRNDYLKKYRRDVAAGLRVPKKRGGNGK